MNYLTENAKDIMEFEYPDWLNIISVHETLGDEDYLWELWIYYEENGQKIIDKWLWEEWEEWYCGYNTEYEFSETYTPEQLKAHPCYSTLVYPNLLDE